MNRTAGVLVLVAAAVLGGAPAFAESDAKLDHADIDIGSTASLQSGARTFADYCVNCHSASLVRYKRLTDLGFSEQQIKDDLMFTGEKKVSQMMDVSMNRADAKLWFGAAPPDLSVVARSRSADWLYSYLRAFYRDPLSATGWNNLVFPRVAMPHALWALQGESVLEVRRFPTRQKAELAQKRLTSYSVIDEETEESGGREQTFYSLRTIRAETPGAMSEAQYDQTVRDLVGFLVWMGEPNQMLRRQAGVPVLIFCFIFVFLTWSLYREVWKDVRGEATENADVGARVHAAPTGIPHAGAVRPAHVSPSIPYDGRAEIA